MLATFDEEFLLTKRAMKIYSLWLLHHVHEVGTLLYPTLK